MGIRVKKLHPKATVPTRSRMSDAGWDLYSLEDVTLFPGETVKIPTGIAMAIPPGKVGLIWDRSGIGSNGVKTHGGVLDSSYRGDVTVCLHNSNPTELDLDGIMYFPAGSRVAQLLIQDVCLDELVEVDELDETDRGDAGFGSSGR